MTRSTVSAAIPRRESADSAPSSCAPTAPAGFTSDVVPGEAAVVEVLSVCHHCDGSGRLYRERLCPWCGGSGEVATEKQVQKRERAAMAAEDRED